MNKTLALVAANTLLIVHVAFVVFVILGLALIYLGYFFNWSWVRNFWFRILHLLAIAIVVLQSWFGIICPLTIWEMQLRQQAGDATYSGSFIAHWLQQLLFYQAPQWVFILCYTIFGALVVLSWFVVKPYRRSKKDRL